MNGKTGSNRDREIRTDEPQRQSLHTNAERRFPLTIDSNSILVSRWRRRSDASLESFAKPCKMIRKPAERRRIWFPSLSSPNSFGCVGSNNCTGKVHTCNSIESWWLSFDSNNKQYCEDGSKTKCPLPTTISVTRRYRQITGSVWIPIHV